MGVTSPALCARRHSHRNSNSKWVRFVSPPQPAHPYPKTLSFPQARFTHAPTPPAKWVHFATPPRPISAILFPCSSLPHFSYSSPPPPPPPTARPTRPSTPA